MQIAKRPLAGKLAVTWAWGVAPAKNTVAGGVALANQLPQAAAKPLPKPKLPFWPMQGRPNKNFWVSPKFAYHTVGLLLTNCLINYLMARRCPISEPLGRGIVDRALKLLCCTIYSIVPH